MNPARSAGKFCWRRALSINFRRSTASMNSTERVFTIARIATDGNTGTAASPSMAEAKTAQALPS